MIFDSINPATGQRIKSYPVMPFDDALSIVERTQQAFLHWRGTAVKERSAKMNKAAALLLERKEQYATLITEEMGKPIKQARAEIAKCAAACEYYARYAEGMLAPQLVKTDARKSYVAFEPLGVVLAIMPWNFPFWQVFRFLAPALMAGNAAVLKHAPNVCGCALVMEEVIRDAGFPQDLFRVLIIDNDVAGSVIEYPVIKAVTLTGSTRAGKAVAAKAGSVLKKCVLELGGSDPYIILKDADINSAVETCVTSRLINSGQSCVAAKRFIVVDALRDALHQQVEKSVKEGARLLLGGKIPVDAGAYYPATVLTDVAPGITAYHEELFGPVATIIPVKDDEQAIAVANDSIYGLGAAVFSKDIRRAEEIARDKIEAGCCFVNDSVRSDPRLPFGGIKESGYGRELSSFGMLEFMNIKTVYIK